VFGEAAFVFDPADAFGEDLSNLFLHTVLERRRGICLTLSLLLLCLADRLQLPLSGVYVPGHLFVRYSEGGTVINLDPSRNGRHFSDSYYSRHYCVSAAAPFCLRALKEAEVYGIYLNNVGTAYARAGWGEKALEILQQAITLAGENPEVHSNMGTVLKQQGRFEEAARAYQQALSLHPRYALAYHQMGNLYRETGRLNDAAEAYARALELQPNLLRAQVNLAFVHSETGRPDEAILLARNALRFDPHDHDAHVVMAASLEAKGRSAQAIREYEAALLIHPDNDEVRTRLRGLGASDGK
jgi:tetratricopeptide (TPR) repeat protein